ncbi:hypothetical protein I302_105968 [Kwoniella bestiolae CBS 10118]|uniref:Palmitoyltransferase n=1 Tax=Kwoniella bestiolae CBS 10118 TaxID=1296100 RepID=A0A1B9G2P7_9TREE|nr:hypothetical protein I302_05092 [Kwoniella bestiolae CBS 10118]OCF25278.1 hypothetical protein I302_05092 [Kwoniella bestiolae CBS 10118]
MVEEQDDKDPEQDQAHELKHSPPMTSSGLALPTRSASVKVFQNDEAGESGPGSGSTNLVRRDSLEDTKSFYGVRPTSPPSLSVHRPGSSLSKVSKRIRSSSLTSNSSSIGAGVGSPPRTSAPLPTPKGFLSPRKPNLAIRLEKKERTSSSSSNFRTAFHNNPHGESRNHDIDKYSNSNIELISSRSISPLQEESEDTHRAEQYNTFGETGLALSDAGSEKPINQKTSNLSLSFENQENSAQNKLNTTGRDKSIGRSITEMSTPPRTATSELSSDELVNNRNSDLEKGVGGVDNSPKSSKKSHKSKPKLRSKASLGRNNNETEGRPRRKYESFENPLTTFFWNGKLMTGGDNWWSILMVTVMLLGLSGVWIGTTGAWMWVHGREYGMVKGGGVAVTIIFVYLFGITASSLIASAFRDPGIIPRRLDPDPPMAQHDDYWEAWPREIDVNGAKVSVKYCETCQSYRPPRSSHCRLCGNCVDGIDHHCSYLHSCVGKRNYFSFFVLLVSATISDIYIIVFSAIHFSMLCHHDNISFGKALSESPGAAVSFLLGVLLILPIMFLLWYHLRLLLYNITTVEQIRANTSRNLFVTSQRPDNPFGSNSLFDNIILASIGRPQFPSWIDASGIDEVDKREVNPALKDLRWVREREGL